MNAAAPNSITAANPIPGHNMPPVVIPRDEDMLADLQRRYPEIDKDLTEFDKAFATYPAELSLKDESVAKALGDLIDQAKKTRRTWKAHATGEKGPLNKLVKVVTNFFTTADETIEKLLGKYEPVLEDYIQKVKAEKLRLQNEEIERQRAKEEAARQVAAEEQRKAEAAARAAEEERRKEVAAREAAARAEEERKASIARAEAQKAEEKRLAEEKRIRDNAEKERNVWGIRDAKAQIKTAERLSQLAQAEEAEPAELTSLENLIKAGGIISTLMTPVASSHLLDEDQVRTVAEIKEKLTELRAIQDAALSRRQQRAREKARQEEEAAQVAEQERRRIAAAEESKRLADAKAAREAEEAAQARLAEERRKAEADARASREAARGLERQGKQADKTAAQAGQEADRAANRADRIEGRLDDRASVRGELGSNSGLTRRWVHYVDDEAAIRTTMGPLGPHVRLDAIEAAAFHWMRAHQDGFEGERVTPAELPGARFSLEEDLTTR